MNEMAEEINKEERALLKLAKLMHIGVQFVAADGSSHVHDDASLQAVLRALGINVDSEESIEQAIEQLLTQKHTRLVEPTLLHTVGTSSTVTVNTGILDYPSVTLILEDGQTYQEELAIAPSVDDLAVPVNGTFMATCQVTIPADVPMGYHTLHVQAGERSAQATLISAPETIETVDKLAPHGKQVWGWMAQLYSIRSSQSWGVGDYADLATLLTQAKRKTGADFILVNPLHAGEPVSPLTPSPYLPAARGMVNVTYIRPEQIAEYADLDDQTKQTIQQLHSQVEPLNMDAQIIDRDAMWRVKMRALWIIFKAGLQGARLEAFNAFKQQMGDRLESYAVWCLCYDKWGAPNGQATWEQRLTKNSEEIIELQERFPDTLEFYRWLEWIAMEQLQAAQDAARKAGMTIGIMADMAVGVHPSGSEVWWNPERFAHGASVGAPPDFFNQQGQNWSQPPLHPVELERTGYRAYRDMVHSMFAAAGAVRIDHILGLFRLWWIPNGASAAQGAYVYYNHEVMLGILAIEANRAGGVIVGEDLGVVPDNAIEALSKKRVLGCTVAWFEQYDGVFRDPADWREMTLASVDTHDMPPAAGYLSYEHVDIRERLHLLSGSVDEFRAGAVAEHNAMLHMLIERKFLDPSLVCDEQAHVQQIVEALYRALKASPSRLLAASLVDAVGERRSQNQPGTNNEYPNWRIPLADGQANPVLLDDLFDLPSVQSLAQIMNQ